MYSHGQKLCPLYKPFDLFFPVNLTYEGEIYFSDNSSCPQPKLLPENEIPPWLVQIHRKKCNRVHGDDSCFLRDCTSLASFSVGQTTDRFTSSHESDATNFTYQTSIQATENSRYQLVSLEYTLTERVKFLWNIHFLKNWKPSAL